MQLQTWVLFLWVCIIIMVAIKGRSTRPPLRAGQSAIALGRRIRLSSCGGPDGEDAEWLAGAVRMAATLPCSSADLQYCGRMATSGTD